MVEYTSRHEDRVMGFSHERFLDHEAEVKEGLLSLSSAFARNSLRIMLYRVFLKLLKPHRSTWHVRRCSQITSYFLTVTIQLPTGCRKRI